MQTIYNYIMQLNDSICESCRCWKHADGSRPRNKDGTLDMRYTVNKVNGRAHWRD